MKQKRRAFTQKLPSGLMEPGVGGIMGCLVVDLPLNAMPPATINIIATIIFA